MLYFVGLSDHVTLLNIYQIKLHLGEFLRQSVESSTHTFASSVILSEIHNDSCVSSCPRLDSLSESCTIIQVSKNSSCLFLR